MIHLIPYKPCHAYVLKGHIGLIIISWDYTSVDTTNKWILLMGDVHKFSLCMDNGGIDIFSNTCH